MPTTEIETEIHRIRLKGVNAWLVRSGERWLLVDTGKPRSSSALMAGIRFAGCKPADISLVVLSHAHYDHVGCARRIKEISSAPIAIHRLEAEVLRSGRFVVSDGLNAMGRFKAFMGRHVVPHIFFSFQPVEPDVIIDSDVRLDNLGFPASIIHTPGHSEGSISVLFDDGRIFTGDLTITQPLPGIWRHMPIYGSSIAGIKRTWRRILDMGAKHIYPSHGADFPADELAEWL
ncbi:MAG: MBL fold metallo-hydrolase [Synergistaceae bacterium]|jgi:glyoxylase-like metal-dependent hydrolase (beta-lactamase superfamily II)|nr:MBL fold metallo-hydrolase [Synergistaceae bacterium]